MKPTRPPLEVDARAGLPLGMPAARFMRDYWQKHPLLIRDAFPGGVSALTPEDLAGLACEEGTLSRLVQHDRSLDAWTVRQGPFGEDEFPTLPDHDWTLLVQDVDKWDFDVASLLKSFDFLPRWRLDDVMVSFAAPGGSVGAHVDQYDVFLLQGKGQRRWQIDARSDAPTAFRDDVELRLLRKFDPTHDWVLAPGDMLYLPPGVPHHGVALDACLTFSIGMRAPSRAEMLTDLTDFLADHLPDSARYADADQRAVRDSGEIDATALTRVEQALPWLRFAPQPDATGDARHPYRESSSNAVIPRALLQTWFGRFITRYRSAGEVAAPPRAPTPARIEGRLQAGALLVRHPFVRIAWARRGRAAELFVDGDVHRCSMASARRLASVEPIDAAHHAALDAGGRALLHDLVARGCFALSRPSRRRT